MGGWTGSRRRWAHGPTSSHADGRICCLINVGQYRFGRQIALNTMMKQHRRCHDQHASLGRYDVPIALLP